MRTPHDQRIRGRGIFPGRIVVGGAIGNGRAVKAMEVFGADLADLADIGTPFVAAKESSAADIVARFVREYEAVQQ